MNLKNIDISNTPIKGRYWERINYNSRPHEVFNSDWNEFTSVGFANRLLPYTLGVKSRALWIYDGAELFKTQPIGKRVFKFDEHKYLISLLSYTYPKNVLASVRKNRIKPTENESLAFFEVDEQGNIDIHFVFGDRMLNYLNQYFSDNKLDLDPKVLIEKVYQSTTNEIKAFFASEISHHKTMQFILKVLGIDLKTQESINSFSERVEIGESKDFVYGWWSYDYAGKDPIERTNADEFRGNLGETVYFQLKVADNVPKGTKIDFQLYDYDSLLFIDFLNRDDKKFNEQEVNVSAKVREIREEKRITIKLLLDPAWKKELREDQGLGKDGHLDLYWKWEYNDILWNSEKIQLSVFNTKRTLYTQPAVSGNYPLPEIFNKDGEILLFAIDQAASSVGDVQKFAYFFVRTTTTFELTSEINQFKQEVYTEVLDLRTETQSNIYFVKEGKHVFKINNNTKQIFIEEELITIPQLNSRQIAIYDLKKKAAFFGERFVEVLDKIMLLNEMYTMVPELGGNGSFNKPNLSTFAGLVPKGGVLAFGISVIEWVVADIVQENQEFIDEYFAIDWHNAKLKGLEAAKRFVEGNQIAIEKGYDYTEISQPILQDLLKGKIISLPELRNRRDQQIKEDGFGPSSLNYTVFHFEQEDAASTVYNQQLNDIIDCVFLNQDNEILDF